MKQRVIMIIGEPAVGKSMLVKELLKLDSYAFHDMKWTPHHQHGLGIVLGRYDDVTHKYPGTDRYSMAVQPHAIAFIQRNRHKNFLFEGDRLGNGSMMAWLAADPEVSFTVIQLWVRDEYLAKRRAEQRQDQRPKFWWSRRTKVSNMIAQARRLEGVQLIVKEHNTPADSAALVAKIRKELLVA